MAWAAVVGWGGQESLKSPVGRLLLPAVQQMLAGFTACLRPAQRPWPGYKDLVTLFLVGPTLQADSACVLLLHSGTSKEKSASNLFLPARQLLRDFPGLHLS